MEISYQIRSKIQNAIAKCRAMRPKVKFIKFGCYDVAGSKGNFYRVFCYKIDGAKFASCECAGAERGYFCYHLAAALAVHIGLAKNRPPSPDLPKLRQNSNQN